MIGLGTIVNVLAIIVGGLSGVVFGRFLRERHQETLCRTCGICVLFLGISGAMEGMLSIEGTSVVSGKSMIVIASLAIGALIGELLNMELWFEQFGEWLKEKSGNSKDKLFVEGFEVVNIP